MTYQAEGKEKKLGMTAFGMGIDSSRKSYFYCGLKQNGEEINTGSFWRRGAEKLREEYVAAVRRNLRSQLNRIDMVNEDGSVENLGEKYDGKRPN